MKDITFYTVMGGSDDFYRATKLAVESIHKKIPSCKIKVFDFDGKFKHEYSETVNCKDQQNLLKKDTDLSIFIGKKVMRMPSKLIGHIEGSFGKSGKGFF